MNEMKENMLEKANAFIASNSETVNPRYRPRFHATAPVGWINDPNGFFYDGAWYHLFYQHYPYEARWNDMHWGHWRTRDLAGWENMPVAMAPDQAYDESGCFSGSAVPDGRGGAHILYTGVSRNHTLQQQCYAHFDGEKVTKGETNPVIPFELLPDGYRANDFRDPCLMRTENGYMAVMAAKSREGGRLVSFSSPDMKTWKYENVFCVTEGIMPECPDVLTVDGKTAVLYSCVEEKERLAERGRPVLYALGSLSDDGSVFTPETWRRVDHGREFYAAQTCEGKGGEKVIIGWMASWDTEYPTVPLNHGWSGMMSLPRVLHRDGSRLNQKPAEGLTRLRGEKTCLTAELNRNGAALRGIGLKHGEIRFQADISDASSVTLNVMEDAGERVSLTWHKNTLALNREHVKVSRNCFVPEVHMPLYAMEGRIDMTVYVDGCSVEVFAGGEVMSALAFPEGDAYDVSVEAAGKAFVKAECWKMR